MRCLPVAMECRMESVKKDAAEKVGLWGEAWKWDAEAAS